MKIIKGFLFDADGVIQQASDNLRALMAKVLNNPAQDIDAFIADIFAAEYSTCTGNGDFEKAVHNVLAKWNCTHNYGMVLKAWLSISPEHSILDIVKNLRSAGLYCAIASNQPICRARFMSENLDYQDIFDDEFYSCDLGYLKPEQEYFKKALIEMPIAADETLFIDDHEKIVSVAIDMGFRGAVFSLKEHDKPANAMKDLLTKYGISVAHPLGSVNRQA